MSVRVRIIDVPPGEAPEAIRRAWVGLTLPLAPGLTQPHALPVFGVLSGPRTTLGYLWRSLFARGDRPAQYLVPVDEALELLEAVAPDAAAWWRENTPHLIGKRKWFGFASHVCEEVG